MGGDVDDQVGDYGDIILCACRNIHSLTNCTYTSSNNMEGVSTIRCHQFTHHRDRQNISVR